MDKRINAGDVWTVSFVAVIIAGGFLYDHYQNSGDRVYHYTTRIGSTTYQDFYVTNPVEINITSSNLTGVSTYWGFYSSPIFGEKTRTIEWVNLH